MTDAEIDALDDPATWSQVFDDKTVVALQLADALSADNTSELDDELRAELRAHHTEVELAEMILICGQANLNNRAGNAAKQLLGPAEGAPAAGA